jgi:hypothetical protein
MPLRLRVCGRSTGAVDVEGAAEEGLEDVDEEGPADEGLGDGDDSGPVIEGLGDALRVGEAEPGSATGVTSGELPGEGGSPGEAGDEDEAGVGLGGAGQVRGEAGPVPEGEAARGVAGGSGERAWALGPRPCRGAGRSTWASDGSGDEGSGTSRISKRAPRPVPAPWLGNSTGEYATSSNWSEAMEDECKEGDSSVETGSLAKGNTRSSNTTSRDM